MSIFLHHCWVPCCDVCGTQFTDPSEGYTPHYDSPATAHDDAVHSGWTELADGRLICTRPDAEHQAVIDALMPPEPPEWRAGQYALDTEENQR